MDLHHHQYSQKAASLGQFGVLRHLIETVGCPWNAEVRKAAAKLGSAEDLQWLQDADAAAWTTTELSQLLVIAGQNDNLSAAKWLRATGAEWPASFLQRIPRYDKVNCWPLRTMQWARASGCPWGAWSSKNCVCCCETKQRSLYVHCKPWECWTRAADPRLLELYDAMLWAHAAGCPCNSWW
jgi:hypothetical protein